MMVAVRVRQSFHRHGQEACGLPHVHAALHEPSRARVAKRVGGNAVEISAPTGRSEALFDVCDRSAVDVQHGP
jgi:hypothetical protein